MSISILIPPKWCSDAILSKFGWVSPKTGEIYVRIKGIKDSDIEAFNKVKYPEVAVSEIVEEAPEEPELEVKEVTTVDVVEEANPARKRKSTKLAQE